MEKKIYKFSIPQSQKNKKIKKLKELKLLSNYVPVKKTYFQSNISEYETEPSIQKNFPNKNLKNAHKPNTQAKSVQNTHSNHFSLNRLINNSISKRLSSNKNKLNSYIGSLYKLNNLNNNNFSNEKKIIERKMVKINTLKKQLLYYVNQINSIEQNNKVFSGTENNIKNNLNELSYNESHSVNQKSLNTLFITKSNNKSFLVNNKSYKDFSQNNNIINNEKLIGIDIADKKLVKQLSNYLTENNSENNFIIYNNCQNENKKILNAIYHLKKGGFKFNNLNNKNNNNNKMKNGMKNYKKNKFQNETSFKSYNNQNLLRKGKNNNIYLYSNKENNQKVPVNQNKVINNEFNINEKFDIQYKNINEKMIILFNSCFDYWKNNQ
jgi:hypothetical protein